MSEPRARRLVAVPGVVLLVCLFLPAMRVCNDPTAPIESPPCYAAYLGGIGIVIIAFARRKRLLAIGAAISPVLGILTFGGLLMLLAPERGSLAVVSVILFGALTLAFSVATVRWFWRHPPTSRTMAAIVMVPELPRAVSLPRGHSDAH
jgi:hypothetical protein